MVNVFKPKKTLEIKYALSSGATSFVVDGDYSNDEYVKANARVSIQNQNTWRVVTISSISYNSSTGESTINFTPALDISFPAGSLALVLARVMIQVGRLDGDNSKTSFSVSEEPSEVRRYNSATPYGFLLQRNSPPQGDQWRYNSSTEQVELGFTPPTGTVVVAFSSGVRIFDDTFLAKDFRETVEELIFIQPTISMDCIYIGLSHYIAADVMPEWFKIGKEVSPGEWDFYSQQVICGVPQNSFVRMKIKVDMLNKNAGIYNFYNVALYIGQIVMPQG